ncbi:hypothetical protein FA13DRAFT_1627901 [Coprinellus micaceus]|uniref:Sodium/calcium exchanger membrane region domain-containing protein n=1 Tax=Coprinellus micaceus TaxID=71717 RepID=A0A4Y7TF80_COPMI|nr:hypothetical protein FA13DRAFT_1627901 [Coprinellus micaceus]
MVRFWDRFRRKGKKNIGVWESLQAIVFSSWLNILLVFIPIAWVSHFLHWPSRTTFALAFLAIIPLEWLVEWAGDEMAHYLGKDLGDLLIVTLHNAVEATLAIILLTHCDLSLLKSTITGVVILHLLLVPGTAFITGGARVLHQDLHPHLTELNHSLLTLGVLSLMLPAAFFAAINTNFNPSGTAEANESIVNDTLRGHMLKMSRGISFCLLFIYICSRIYLHIPPGEKEEVHSQLPDALKKEELHLQRNEPRLNQYVGIVLLAVVLGLMAATAEWLVKSLNFAREDTNIQLEWFGLILLPLVSYAADGTVAIVYFLRHLLRHFFREPSPPQTLAKGRAIDLSIQFTLFWMPFFVLLGWWTGRPMTLLFDFFEVAVLIGACFIVNYVTADSKTNWAEGATMVSFYVMIAVCAWYYPGQTENRIMSTCPQTVAEALEALASGHSLEGHH